MLDRIKPRGGRHHPAAENINRTFRSIIVNHVHKSKIFRRFFGRSGFAGSDHYGKTSELNISVNRHLNHADFAGNLVHGLHLRRIGVNFLRLNGASPTPIPFMEVYDALSKGVVDGTLNSITDLTAVRLHEKAKYMTLDGHNFMFSAWFMNASYFKSLPKEFQDALIDGFKLMGIVENGVQMDMERPAYAAFAKAGGQTYFPTAEEKAQFIEVVKPLRDMYLQETEGGAEFLKELDAAIANASKFEQNRRASFDALK